MKRIKYAIGGALLLIYFLAILFSSYDERARAQIVSTEHTHASWDFVGAIYTDLDITQVQAGSTATIVFLVDSLNGDIYSSGTIYALSSTSAIYVSNVFATDVFVSNDIFASGSITASDGVWVPLTKRIGFDDATRTRYFTHTGSELQYVGVGVDFAIGDDGKVYASDTVTIDEGGITAYTTTAGLGSIFGITSTGGLWGNFNRTTGQYQDFSISHNVAAGSFQLGWGPSLVGHVNWATGSTYHTEWSNNGDPIMQLQDDGDLYASGALQLGGNILLTTGTASRIDGGDTAGDDLILAANNDDTCAYIKLEGGSDMELRPCGETQVYNDTLQVAEFGTTGDFWVLGEASATEYVASNVTVIDSDQQGIFASATTGGGFGSTGCSYTAAGDIYCDGTGTFSSIIATSATFTNIHASGWVSASNSMYVDRGDPIYFGTGTITHDGVDFDFNDGITSSDDIHAVGAVTASATVAAFAMDQNARFYYAPDQYCEYDGTDLQCSVTRFRIGNAADTHLYMGGGNTINGTIHVSGANFPKIYGDAQDDLSLEVDNTDSILFKENTNTFATFDPDATLLAMENTTATGTQITSTALTSGTVLDVKGSTDTTGYLLALSNATGTVCTWDTHGNSVCEGAITAASFSGSGVNQTLQQTVDEGASVADTTISLSGTGAMASTLLDIANAGSVATAVQILNTNSAVSNTGSVYVYKVGGAGTLSGAIRGRFHGTSATSRGHGVVGLLSGTVSEAIPSSPSAAISAGNISAYGVALSVGTDNAGNASPTVLIGHNGTGVLIHGINSGGGNFLEFATSSGVGYRKLLVENDGTIYATGPLHLEGTGYFATDSLKVGEYQATAGNSTTVTDRFMYGSTACTNQATTTVSFGDPYDNAISIVLGTASDTVAITYNTSALTTASFDINCSATSVVNWMSIGND